MTDLFALTYVSDATRDLLPRELDSILVDARVFNASVGVTGALFYGNNRFFQLLEGEKSSVQLALDRIQRSSSHANLRVLSQGRIAARFFNTWHMGFVQPPTSAIQELSQALWEEAIPYTREDAEKSEGIGQLMYHWNRWAADVLPTAP